MRTWPAGRGFGKAEETKITESFTGGSLLRRGKEASGACSELKRGPSHGRDSQTSRNNEHVVTSSRDNSYVESSHGEASVTRRRTWCC